MFFQILTQPAPYANKDHTPFAGNTRIGDPYLSPSATPHSGVMDVISARLALHGPAHPDLKYELGLELDELNELELLDAG